MGRPWKILGIGAVAVLSVLVLIFALVFGWVWYQMQPKDITAARGQWPANMSLEDADAAAVDLVSKMTLDEKMAQMHGEGITRMMLSMVLENDRQFEQRRQPAKRV